MNLSGTNRDPVLGVYPHVLGQMVRAHEALAALGTLEALLARVRAAVALQLVRAGEPGGRTLEINHCFFFFQRIKKNSFKITLLFVFLSETLPQVYFTLDLKNKLNFRKRKVRTKVKLEYNTKQT